jgi:broad specificity phosphatase PhoE
MRRLILVRHGESEANISHTFANRGDGPPLTDAGRRQAATLAHRLHGTGIAEIHSSPLIRSVQTAVEIGAVLGRAVVVDEALREYDVGELEGQANPYAWAAYADLERRWLVDRDWSARHPGGESYHEIVSRFGAYLARVRAVAAAPVLAVAHGGLFRMALPHHAVGYTYEESLRIKVPNCGVIVLEPDGRLATLEEVAEPISPPGSTARS